MKHIDKLFKEKLYHHEAIVPEGMWEKIAPIAEEESGRAILWFWFAGLLTLLLGGYGIYKLATHSTDPGTLVYESQTSSQTSTALVDNKTEKESSILTDDKQLEAEEETNSSSTVVDNTIKKELIEKVKTKQSEITTSSKSNISIETASPSSDQGISNTVESISNVVGVPANLVITKSYINKEGSVIKRTNLTDDSGNEGPVYNVIINSEAKDLNAGALLRIIEPLENIPLPAFQKELKKKTLTTIL